MGGVLTAGTVLGPAGFLRMMTGARAFSRTAYVEATGALPHSV